MAHSRKFTVGQINLAGAQLATTELPLVAQRLGLDVVLVQEHYPGPVAQPPAAAILQCGDRARAGIYIRRRDVACALIHHLSNTHCIVCHVLTDKEGVYLISAYFQYSDDIDVHLEHLGMVLASLRGKKVIIGVDSNAHSPMWYCESRQYTGRGPDVTHRRESMEAFILAHGLRLANAENQPATFATANGTSNIDLTLTKGTLVTEWRVHENVIDSDHRLITFVVADKTASSAERTEEPMKFRERGVDWEIFEWEIRQRIGTSIQWNRSAKAICAQFTKLVNSTALQTLGLRRTGRTERGYEWWTPDLDRLRRETYRLRRTWQSSRRGSNPDEEAAKLFHKRRREYREAMKEAQLKFFRSVADSGNLDPWGQAYRVASGRLRPPHNVVNGTKYAEGYAGGVEDAMHSLMYALCPDDDTSRDTEYHRQVRVMAALIPSGEAAPPPTQEVVGTVVKGLPNTAPGIDGITSRIVKHVWAAAPGEMTEVFRRCVQEGVFPDVWKDGRLVVLPKGNGKQLTDPKAYRPVTLLPIFGKILERLLLKCATQMTRGLSDCQHGFTRGRSTVSALTSILDNARESSSKYVQAIFLDISGAFDNAWWPMILLKAKRGGCPPNIYRMLTDYFVGRRVGMFVGRTVVWKAATMGCPQGSVLGPTLWNILMDDLLRLPLPGGVKIVAYADDVTILVEADARSGLELKSSEVLRLVGDWGVRNRLEFSSVKSSTMTLRGKFQRPPTIRYAGNSIKSVASATVLGVVIDANLSFSQHAVSIGERAANCFGKMSRVSATSWGVRYRALRVLYQGTFVATVTYAAACWYKRASLHVVRSALLRTQRPALILLTKAYRSSSTDALAVLAGVLPADLEVLRAGRLGVMRESAITKEELKRAKLRLTESAHAAWQERWDTSNHGRELYRFFPEVEARLKATWVEPDYEVSQILSGHGCFRGRLFRMNLSSVGSCYCGEAEVEDVHHALWECSLYGDARRILLDGIKINGEGPVYYCDLVATAANFGLLRDFAHRWHNIRSGLEREEDGMTRRQTH